MQNLFLLLFACFHIYMDRKNGWSHLASSFIYSKKGFKILKYALIYEGHILN